MAKQENGPAAEGGLSAKTVVGGILAVLAVVFVVQNTDRGSVDFLFWTLTMPAWIWLLTTFAVGLVAGSLFPWLRPRKKS